MKFAASNIAWPAESRFEVYTALADQGFDGLEIAPGLFFFDADDPFTPDEQQCARAMGEIADAGLAPVSMQSLLFGVQGAALFEGENALKRLEDGMIRAIRLAGRVGIPNLVFGAPKQRIVPPGLTQQEARHQAADVFRRLGDVAVTEGTRISIEANPAVFGTNFLTHASQALDFAQMVAHAGIGFILDTGEMHTNAAFDTTPALIRDAGGLLFHVHFSEPELAAAPARVADASGVLGALGAQGYDGAVSIEMRTTSDPVRDVTAAIGRLRQARDTVIKELDLT